MASSSSNKRQRLEPPAGHQDNVLHDTHNLPHYKDLADQPLMMYEGTPTEAQFVEIVEKLDQSDVRKLLHQAVDYLDQSDVRKLLVNAAVSNELVETKVVGELTRIRRLCENEQVRRYQELFTPPLQPARPVPQPERPVVLETETETEALGLEKNIQQVDDIINKRYAKLRGPKQLEKAGEAADLVKQEIAKIAQSTTWRSQYETKMNAILALLDIGNIIIDGTNSISAEVRKQVGYNESFAKTVMDIVALMLPSEVQAFAEDDIQTLEEFSIKRRACDIFDGFEEVVNHFGCTLLASSGLGYNPYGDDDYGDIDE
ncbi:unnamed protein product [Aureobasidium mustum]|uniref:Uncharacterized protein n=1 Tax=Aureobasidium mustum TaxID=2773714 RepID=A0A9N8JMJ9_9PEZI|nr:unnamed protein product [Aureobasidium mustum]